MHCKDTTSAYYNEFIKYIKVKGGTSEDAIDYLFDVGAEKFLSEKGKIYLHEFFEKGDPEHLQLDENFDDYLNSCGL